ncbi:MAG: Dabb family protein [Phycisphaerales bacterium]|jgi:hypothetical protein|nr:Dabb family protein [Phycisphaerales bacterium]
MMKRFGLSALLVLVSVCWLAGCAPEVSSSDVAIDHSGDFRHVVLFKFKDEANAADINAIEKQIMDMQPQIPTIKAMEWGTDVSCENLQDEFTHAFLVTFKDPAGLKVYSPHDAHQAVMKSLGPIMEKVLVFDYIAKDATPPMAPIVTRGKLRHVVMFQFKDDATAEQIAAVEAKFRSLPARIPEIKAFECGKLTPGRGANADLTHCFLVTFDDAAGRLVYLPHPAHKEFVELVGPVLEKVLVIDYIATK